MPVPSYNLIADSEIDPESPLTSSLFFRLRDNWLAVFGIDNTDPAPAPALPPSVQKTALVVFAASSTSIGAVMTTAEHIVSTIAEAIETVDVVPGIILSPLHSNDSNSATTSVCLFHRPTTGDPWSLWKAYDVSSIEVQYASGAPTGVRVNDVATLTLANTWQTIASNIFATGHNLEGKARADSDFVYLQLRINSSAQGPSAGGFRENHLLVKATVKSYKAKAAP
jgi:hypothetical protein